MPQDLLKEFLKATARILNERAEIVERLQVLNEILERSGLTTTVQPHTRIKSDEVRLDSSTTSPRRGRPSKLQVSQSTPLLVNQEVHHFPVAMFLFSARAEAAFERAGITKLGQLHDVDPASLGGRNIGKGTLESIREIILRINRGELSFSETKPVPISSFVQLVDAGLAAIETPVAIAVQRRLGTELTLESIGSELNVTRERVRQMETLGISQLSRVHGAKFFQIGKELGRIAKERAIEFGDISNNAHVPQFSEPFYWTVLQRMFPGLRLTIKNDQEVRLASPSYDEPPSPTELRNQIFGGENS